MNKELFFLRSSEQKIVDDMAKFAYPDMQDRSIYTDFYGLTRKDLGLYCLDKHKIAGAIWTRRLNIEHNSSAFIDENTPVMSMAIVPEFDFEDIGQFMMDQFLLEAGALYNQISVDVKNEHIEFYEKFGFKRYKDNIYIKGFEIKEVVRPSDGYDPTRWMD
jgi:ribosomal protein S18 acetylase RimI-like enzyme